MGFDAHSISSLGLSTALTFEGMNKPDMSLSDYFAALLNILETQDFDSIPLVDQYGGEIKKIAMRVLDSQVRSVKILELDEVALIPQSSSVIHCIFEVLSNPDNIVFLTDEYGVIHDVVTIGMLTNPVIEEYLILLDHRLSQVNSKLKNTEFALKISEGLSQLHSLSYSVSGDRKFTDPRLSKIRDIISVLRPIIKQKSLETVWNTTDYSVTPKIQHFDKDTAGFFAIHPFGAISEDKLNPQVEDIAFEAFSRANDWTSLLYKTDIGYKQVLRFESTTSSKIIRKDCTAIHHGVSYRNLLRKMSLDLHEPISVEFDDSKYPGIITLRDLVYSDSTKLRIMKASIEMETAIRDRATMVVIDQDRLYSNWGKGTGGYSPCRSPLRALVSFLVEHGYLSEAEAEEIDQLISSRNDYAHIRVLSNRETRNDIHLVESYFDFLFSGEDYIHNLCLKLSGSYQKGFSDAIQSIDSYYSEIKNVNPHFEEIKKAVNKFKLRQGSIVVEINKIYNMERFSSIKGVLDELVKPYNLILELNNLTSNSKSESQMEKDIEIAKKVRTRLLKHFKSDIKNRVLKIFNNNEGRLELEEYTDFVRDEFDKVLVYLSRNDLSEIFEWKAVKKYHQKDCIYLLECLKIPYHKSTCEGLKFVVHGENRVDELLNPVTAASQRYDISTLSSKKGNLKEIIKEAIIEEFSLHNNVEVEIDMVDYKLRVRQLVNKILFDEPKLTKSEFAEILGEPRVKSYTSNSCIAIIEALGIDYELSKNSEQIIFSSIITGEE